MIYLIGLSVVVLIILGIAKLAGSSRYAQMTEEEFELDAKRSSLMGAAMIGLQKTIDPGHRVEFVQEQQQRAEADAAESAGPPEAGRPSAAAPKDRLPS